MSDLQKRALCDKCGGPGKLEAFEIVQGLPPFPPCFEMRWRVKCAAPECGHMTPHFGSPALALTLWNSWAAADGQADKLAG